MAARHLFVGSTMGPTIGNLIRAYCGCRVARRNTTPDWRTVTCRLCLGRRDGITAKAIQDARALTETTK